MIKTIDQKQINELHECLSMAWQQLQNYEVTLVQHGIEGQRQSVSQAMREIRTQINVIENLTDRPPMVLNATEEDRNLWKSFGFAEAVYLNEFGVKTNVNSFTEFENATFEINKKQQEER